MFSSKIYTCTTSSVSKEIATTPGTSATPLPKPTWASTRAFSSSPSAEDFNDVGNTWSDTPWPTQSISNNSPPSAFSPSQSAFVPESPWGTGPPVQIPAWHTHFTILDSMDKRSGETHYLLESNRGVVFHGHHPTDEWNKLRGIGEDGSQFAALEMRVVDVGFLFPVVSRGVPVFKGGVGEGVYMKKQPFLFRNRFKNAHHADCTAQEVRRCEQISKTPHRNLARYLGIETRRIGGEERVVRIAYQRYSMDLYAFVLMKRYLQPHHVPLLLQGVERGMRHLHSIGLVHCDLRPMNVFVTIEEERDEHRHVVLKEVVIGDFDASVEIGEEVSLKRASKDWWPVETDWGVKAEKWIDEWCLEKMGKWLKEDGLGIWDFGAASAAPFPNAVDGPVGDIMTVMPDNGWW